MDEERILNDEESILPERIEVDKDKIVQELVKMSKKSKKLSYRNK